MGIISAAGGRGLGQVNPLEMMRNMFELRNMQTQYQANMRAGQIWATSPTADAALEGMRQDPLSAFMLPQATSAMEQQRTAADVAATQARMQQTQQQVDFEKVKFAVQGGTNQAETLKLLSDAEATAAPANKAVLGHIYDSLAGPMSDAEFANKRRGLLQSVGGLGAREAFGTQGLPPPEYQVGPWGPSGEQQGMVFSGGGAQPVMTGPGAGLGVNLGPPQAANLPGTVPPTAPAPTPAPTARPLTAPPAGVKEQVESIGNEMEDAGANAPMALKRLDTIYGALQGFQAGGGAEARTAWGSKLQALKDAGFPIPQALIDGAANRSLTDSQLFMAQIKPFLTEQLREAVGSSGAGRIRTEVQTFLNLINASTDPNTIVKLLNQAKYSLQMSADRAVNWPQFRDNTPAGVRPSDYYTWWNQNRHDRMIQSIGTDLSLGQFDPAEVRGTKEYQQTHGKTDAGGNLRVDRTTGKIWEVQPDGSYRDTGRTAR